MNDLKRYVENFLGKKQIMKKSIAVLFLFCLCSAYLHCMEGERPRISMVKCSSCGQFHCVGVPHDDCRRHIPSYTTERNLCPLHGGPLEKCRFCSSRTYPDSES